MAYQVTDSAPKKFRQAVKLADIEIKVGRPNPLDAHRRLQFQFLADSGLAASRLQSESSGAVALAAMRLELSAAAANSLLQFAQIRRESVDAFKSAAAQQAAEIALTYNPPWEAAEQAETWSRQLNATKDLLTSFHNEALLSSSIAASIAASYREFTRGIAESIGAMARERTVGFAEATLEAMSLRVAEFARLEAAAPSLDSLRVEDAEVVRALAVSELSSLGVEAIETASTSDDEMTKLVTTLVYEVNKLRPVDRPSYNVILEVLMLLLAVYAIAQDHVGGIEARKLGAATIQAVDATGERTTNAIKSLAVELQRAGGPQYDVVRGAVLRAGPSAKSKPLAHLQAGQLLVELERKGRWLLVEIVELDDGAMRTGWVFDGRLRRRRTSAETDPSAASANAPLR